MEKHIYKIEDEIFISINFLISKGVPKKTVTNGMRQYLLGKTDRWQTLILGEYDKTRFVNFKYIPQNTIARYKLPSHTELLLLLAQESARLKEQKSQQANQNLALAKAGVEYAYNRKWVVYAPLYSELKINKDKILDLARTHAVFEEIRQLDGRGYNIKLLYDVYRSLIQVVFQPKTINSFYRKFKEMKAKGIKETLTHGSIGKKKENIKLSKLHQKLIKQLYRDPRKLSHKQISDQVNKEMLSHGYDAISLSTVKKFLAQPEIQNECKPFRNGDKYAKENILPYMVRSNAHYAGDQWQIDGTRFQFLCDKEGRIGFLNLFVVLDVHSKKIVGFALDDTENVNMIFEALKRACYFTGHIAAEIVHDNFSGYSSNEFRTLVEHSSFLGVQWRPTRLGNSGDNGYVERFFQTFQSIYCKTQYGYIGEGIRSKRENAHPAPELIAEYRKPENIRDRNGLILLADQLIKQYNSTSSPNDKLSPDLKYQISQKVNIISLEAYQIADLFWKTKEIKVHRSMIRITVNKALHHYTLWDRSISNKINDTHILVKYDHKDTSNIYLFTKDNEFITYLAEDDVIPVASVNHTDEDKKVIRNFISRRQKFIEDNRQKLEDEETEVNESYGNFPIEALNPSTTIKQELTDAETKYTLDQYGIEIKDIKPIAERTAKSKNTRKKIAVRNTPAERTTGKYESILNEHGPFNVEGDLSVLS